MPKWYDEPHRDELRATSSDEPRPHRARKNTRRWCRGKVGVEHVLEIRLGKHAEYRCTITPDSTVCYRTDITPKRWRCSHERYCVNCGKILNYSIGVDCPDFTEKITVHWRRS
jgi:hypothetical protein